MARVWSEEHKLERWLDVELAALDAWAELRVIPEDIARSARQQAVTPTPGRVRELEEKTGHDLAAFVDAVGEGLDDEGRRWLHYGLTSSDVLDTALALQAGGRRLALGDLDRAFAAVVARAEEHRQTLIMGRTHGIHAEPTTFGLKLAGWAFELDRGRVRLERALEGMRSASCPAPSARTRPQGRSWSSSRVSVSVSSRRLSPRRSSSEIGTRSPGCARRHRRRSTRSALEIRHLARTEVREVEEPFAAGQKGSSAMPHKRNPITAERICGLARVVRGAAQVGLENVALWHERDISHSSAERVVIPDAFLAVDYMLDRFAWLVEGLVVHADRMRENLDASHGLYFSQRLLLALVDSGLARDDAYRLQRGWR